MTKISGDLAALRASIRRTYRTDFDFTRVSQVAFARGGPPVRAARLALVSTAGLHFPDQPRFDRWTAAGDCSFRQIPRDSDLSRLRIWWDGKNQRPANQDLNSAFPLAVLRELAAGGEIGSLAATHLSFNGSIPDPLPLIERIGPQAARLLRGDGVEIVLAAPG
jgi:hypothetical protein